VSHKLQRSHLTWELAKPRQRREKLWLDEAAVEEGRGVPDLDLEFNREE
jgi:hypothetical protein